MSMTSNNLYPLSNLGEKYGLVFLCSWHNSDVVYLQSAKHVCVLLKQNTLISHIGILSTQKQPAQCVGDL